MAWIVKVHPNFQQYLRPHMGGVRARESYRGHPWFDDSVELCEKCDQNPFDSRFEHRPLEFLPPDGRAGLSS
ncbi:hypothetical protein NIIDNTM18_06700 [Mycolicibacterium litorale]|uniref:Uncharacterized protein n=1 Tax=Mycolicibacterium litorale TaxID=758802 RepID=A0A6S6NZW1_9MYCO|nr:hypothetical protein NIIDNTM18_06700 [Mycolicibacterium litorale]